jgi:hypothetical protein
LCCDGQLAETSCERTVKERLNESEERELIRRAKAGDDGARNHLWEAFFLFAVSECRKQAQLMNLDPGYRRR